MTKAKKLGAIFISLLMVSIILQFVGRKDRTRPADKSIFTVADTTQIQRLTVTQEDQTIQVNRNETEWTLNNQYQTDPQLVYLFQRILQAVETQRPVSRSNFEHIKTNLQSAPKVEVTFSDGQSMIFYAGGNQAKSTAYFGNEDLSQIYIVVIPGYKTYVSGIFELTLNQWRDRTLFNSSWRTLQNLTIDYSNQSETDLSISFSGKFLDVKGVAQLDTAALMNYLQPLEGFQLNDYLKPGSFPRYDSLMNTTPLAKITVRDINRARNLDLTVFNKIEGERFYLVANDSLEMIVVDQRRMEAILTNPSTFMRQQ